MLLKSTPTTKDLLADLERVQYGCGDAGHCANHTSQPQVDQHEEEHDRPEGTGREMCHGLSESYKCQTSALNRLDHQRRRKEHEAWSECSKTDIIHLKGDQF